MLLIGLQQRQGDAGMQLGQARDQRGKDERRKHLIAADGQRHLRRALRGVRR